MTPLSRLGIRSRAMRAPRDEHRRARGRVINCWPRNHLNVHRMRGCDLVIRLDSRLADSRGNDGRVGGRCRGHESERSQTHKNAHVCNGSQRSQRSQLSVVGRLARDGVMKGVATARAGCWAGGGGRRWGEGAPVPVGLQWGWVWGASSYLMMLCFSVFSLAKIRSFNKRKNKKKVFNCGLRKW